jgi:cytochrome oxidase Cu insertion factor (SCO1/SenC/PrrC family)
MKKIKTINCAFILLIIMAVTLSILTACNNRTSKDDNPKDKTVGYKEGETAPDFNILDFNGKNHSLEGYRGKIVILNFWAST